MSGITHAFTSAKADGTDTTLVKPSDWNAAHVIGDGTLTIDAASSVATFTTSSGSIVALTLNTNTFGPTHLFDWGTQDAPYLALHTTSGGAGGPGLACFHESASPAASDVVGSFYATGKDSAGNPTNYTVLSSVISDPTNGTETAKIVFQVLSSGSLVSGLTVGDTGQLGVFATYFDYGNLDAGSTLFKSTAGSANGPQLVIFHETASPAVNDVVHAHKVIGKDLTPQSVTYSQWQWIITDATGGSADVKFVAQNVVNGSPAECFTSANGFYHSSATGTDKGNNTTNFSNQYDDGTLLITCYVDEAAHTGKVDLEFWDSLVDGSRAEGCAIAPDAINAPPSKHYGAHKFAARLGTEYDPTTIAGQRKHVNDKKHLTPYQNRENFSEQTRPSLGSWIQRGVEMDELLFLYISQLEDRIKVLETVH